MAKSILEGIVYDKTTPEGIVYAASICYPQTDLYVPISITISPDGKISMKKEELLEEVYDEDTSARYLQCEIVPKLIIDTKKITIMKKILSILVLAIAAVQFAFAGDIITKDAMKLPLPARNFINRHFSNPQISHIKIENEILQTKKYDVLLTNATEIDFDNRGNWIEVDCKKAAVPATIVPDFVKEYMKANGYHSEFVTQIERDRKGYEVELNTDLSLKFTKDGKFRKAEH